MSQRASDIEQQIDIVDLVTKYTKLKKAWANYKAVCPFPGHNEKTPSFVVSPSKQLAYCFGCHKWGWPIKFVMDLENYEFREALEVVANIAWVKLAGYDKEKEQAIKNMYSLYKDIHNYYKQSLKNYPKVVEYIWERWITAADLETFQLGYSDSGIELYNSLKNKWYEDHMIQESWVFHDLKTKKDKFINRLIFPIQNQRWDVIAFAGRVMNDAMPKYLNSAASKIYDKSSILYWLYQARHEITQKDFVIVTEGYIDVIALHRYNYKNTVCVSGTALTEKHIAILKRLTRKVYLCFDSDDAWLNATLLSIELMKNTSMELKIIALTWWKDPDEILSSWEDFDTLIQQALSPIEFLIQKTKHKYDLTSIEDKKKYLMWLLEMLREYSDAVEQDFYLKQIARALDINRDMVYSEFAKTRAKRRETEASIVKTEYRAYEYAIGYVLINKEYKELFCRELLFFDDLPANLRKILKDDSYLQELDLDTRDRYNAISLKIDDMNLEKTDAAIMREIHKLIRKINLDIYKQKRELYLTEGKQQELVELLSVAREHGLK